MIKHFLAGFSAVLLLAVNVPAKADIDGIPADRIFPSSTGEVTFHHEMHIKDFGISCVDCHHSINAKPFAAARPSEVKSSSDKSPVDVKTSSTPHPDYLKASSIKCASCHSDSDAAKQKPYSCSGCHPTNPANIADETLSAKVVVHQQCWKCHAVGTGKEASKGCEKCHTGKKKF